MRHYSLTPIISLKIYNYFRDSKYLAKIFTWDLGIFLWLGIIAIKDFPLIVAILPGAKWAEGVTICVLIQARLLWLPTWERFGPTEPPFPLIVWQAMQPSELNSEGPDAAKAIDEVKAKIPSPKTAVVKIFDLINFETKLFIHFSSHFFLI